MENRAALPLNVIHPVTQKSCKPYFLVYSPKEFDDDVHRSLMELFLEPSPHSLATIEWGENKTHKHANYFFYHSARDAFNLKRQHRHLTPPTFKIKAVTSPGNVISYMTKEGELAPQGLVFVQLLSC